MNTQYIPITPIEVEPTVIESFTEGGIISFGIGLFLLILSNALSYLLVKSFGIQSYYGRFIGGIMILFISLLLSSSTDFSIKFKSAFLFGMGEIIIGVLNIINDRLSSSLPLLVPDPGCQGGSA
jgi:hypothetical protein